MRYGRVRDRKNEPSFELGRVKVLHISAAALRIEVLDGPHAGAGAEGEEAVWCPKSQIHPTSEIDDTSFVDTEGTLTVTEWIAKQKGWM